MLGKCSQGFSMDPGAAIRPWNSEADSSVTAAQYLNQVKSAAKKQWNKYATIPKEVSFPLSLPLPTLHQNND